MIMIAMKKRAAVCVPACAGLGYFFFWFVWITYLVSGC